MRLLVTGATGLLGNNLVRQAVQAGYKVTTLSRSPANHSSLMGLPVQHISFDLAAPDVSKLDNIQADVVIHAAALIHIGWKRLEESLKINRGGTEAILNWAHSRSVRAIYISTVNVLATATPENPTHEESKGDGQIPCSYVVSKRAGQRVCDQLIESGADCYSVYPGFLVGPNDWQLSSGKMIQTLQRFQPWAPSGGCSVCDPRDLADSILNIAAQGAPSRHYVLGGENMTYRALWDRLAIKLGKRPPFLTMRTPAKVIGRWIANTWNAVRSKELEFNSATILMGQQFHYCNSERAKRELGYESRRSENSIDDAIEWLRAQKLLRQQKELLRQ